MKKKCVKTLKRGATKKAKTGTTKKARSSTRSKERTSPISYYATVELSNSKDISIIPRNEKCALYATLTRNSTLEFSFLEITPSVRDRKIGIRLGPNGLDILAPSGEVSQTIGWFEEIDEEDYWSKYE